ncbi:hypothetical protein PUNSTDRAFT_141242 [Punctularia strigosozonata HHB-11173 SS5]|uniref:uncharacterized protein n=1 Tax=Punctularia strigosozonata (strain HHB-11173) TaxID=741275 RepID=UPI00044177A2|nr:uncharacterized protein PUNSTDRAFT_141242 [Punctularia strigosozonata HHB-11173 SS5]EIN12573.1 hypothetical protein PUNSTDRAFT_141242 [Punctularia strigosozonata HHB-11173 SS5]
MVCYGPPSAGPVVPSSQPLDDEDGFARARFAFNSACKHNTVFASDGSEADLDVAIDLLRRAMALFAHHPNDRLYVLVNLGNSLHHRYRLSKKLADAEEAVDIFRHALIECSADHPLRRYVVDSFDCTSMDLCLWMTHMFHYQQGKNLDFLEEATAIARETLGIMSGVSDDPDGRPRWLSRLVLMRLVKFGHTGDPRIIDEAMDLSREAISLTPVGHPRRAFVLTTFASTISYELETRGSPPTLVDIPTLDHATFLLEEALTYRPKGHEDRGDVLTFLADMVKYRAQITPSVQARENLLALRKETLDECPPGHFQRHQALYALAEELIEPSPYPPSPEDLELAASCSTEAWEMMKDGHPARFMASYCLSYVHLHKGEYGAAIDCLSRMIEDNLGNVKDRMAHALILVSELQRHLAFGEAKFTPDAIDGLLQVYSSLLQLPPRMAFRSLNIQSRLRQVTTWETLARDAALTALRVGKPELAIEYLEQGRASFWSQSLHLREDFDQLPDHLSQELVTLSRALEEGSFGPDQPELSMERVSERFDALVEEARKLPGLTRFLMSDTYPELARTANSSNAHVVVLLPGEQNICHAIIIGRDGACTWVPLPGLTPQELGKYAVSMKHASLSYRREMPQRDGQLRLMMVKKSRRPPESGNVVLTELWHSVVKPVVTALNLRKSAGRDRPRVIWVPTGPFAFVPVHAAGVYAEDERHCCSDYFVSSYAPTLSALRNAQKKLRPIQRSTSKILLAAAPSPYDPEWQFLPFTKQELADIDAVVPDEAFLTLPREDDASHGDDCGARVPTILRELPNATILHLACHGYQDPKNPLASGFLLRDEMLTIAKLMPISLPNAFLAFLSACETAKGDTNQPDQTVHLAAAMLFAGFKSVIATLWSMGDMDGPLVARTVYEELFRGDSEHLDPRIVPYALDAAVQKLRDIDPNPSRWAPYIHIGC